MQETYTSYITKIIKRYPYLFFFIICLVLYLPATFFRNPFYPDELRILYIVDNLHSLSDYIFPKYFNGIYYQKPPLYFWIIKLLLRIKLNNILLLPILLNVLISWGVISLNYSFLKRDNSAEIGLISSLFLATTIVFYGMSILVRMDTLFLLFIFLNITSFQMVIRKKRIFLLLLPACFGFLAVFTKGALGLILPLFIEICLAIFLRDKRILTKALLANLIAFILVIFWLISFSSLDRVYFQKMVFEQTFARAFESFKHTQSYFYYLPFIFLLFLPWSFLGISYFFRIKKNKYLWEKLYLIWFAGGIIILSLINSKMPMYLLTLSIPFCGLAAKFFYFYREEKSLSMLFYFTAGFFILAWFGAFFYFKARRQFVPGTSFILLFLFLLVFFLNLRKSPSLQFANLFIFWILVLETINFLYLPIVSNASEINKVAEAIKRTSLSYDKIYVSDKSLLFLKFYHIAQPIIYLNRLEMACLEKNFILVTKDNKTLCSLNAFSRTNKFYLFYKKK